MSAPTNSALGTGTVQYAHTPGPWIVCPPYTNRNVYPIGHARGDGATDILAEANSCGGSPEHCKANAALIARAPDLLAEVTALRASLGDAVELVESLRSERDTKQRACDALKDHIDQQTNAGVELRRIVRAMLDDCDRGLFELPCGYFNELRAALGRAAL